MAYISEKEGLITMAARLIPKWFRPFAALLISKDEIGRSYRAMSNSVHRFEHEGRVRHTLERRERILQGSRQLRDAICPER